jgi:hypothetical protein
VATAPQAGAIPHDDREAKKILLIQSGTYKTQLRILRSFAFVFKILALRLEIDLEHKRMRIRPVKRADENGGPSEGATGGEGEWDNIQ